MAGHSKFKNIQHRKGAQDKKRAKVFNKLAREIMVAAKLGNPDPDMNPRLRGAIIAARAANMPNDRIKRAVDSSKENADTVYDEIRYEGYGPGGVAVIVDALTDNRNRTAGEVRTAFSKNGGTMGEANSVSFMFDRIGLITYPDTVASMDDMFEAAVEAGAENVEEVDENFEITTAFDELFNVREALEKKYEEAANSELIWAPKNTIELNEKHATTLLQLIDSLEDNDDVQKVSANFEIADDILERLAG